MNEIKKCKQLLKKSAEKSLKNGYKGDWADAMFRVYVLELLEKIAKQKVKKNPSAYNMFITEETSKGFTLIEAAKKWKKKLEGKG